MGKIIRTPTMAKGGITAEEKIRLDAVAKEWIGIAMRTDPIDFEKIEPAIIGLYAAAGLKAPRVVIAPSPLVMAFAYGAAAAIWHKREHDATDIATRSATDIATAIATFSATDSATRSATFSATDSATRSATDSAASACFELAGELGLHCAGQWSNVYQGGNMWAGWPSYLAGMRDVIGLRLPEHEKYQFWEDAARHGGFRVMHPEFCIVCDFPEVIRVDEQNRPHCETGPSHRWRDGWSLYHWHGVAVPAHWIEQRATLSAAEVLREQNVEVRMAGCQIIGWARVADQLDRRVIDGDPSSDIGALVELTLPGLPDPGRFLMAQCPRNGTICEGVPRVSDIDGLPIETAIAAQAWRDCLPASEYTHPAIRT